MHISIHCSYCTPDRITSMSNVRYTLNLPNLEKVGDVLAKILLTRSVRCRAGLQEEKGGMRRRLGENEMAYLRYFSL